MQYSYFASVLLSAAFALRAAGQETENTVTFVSLDSIDRTMHFASNPECEQMEPILVPGGQNVTVVFPYGWQGNTFAVADGSPVVPGMLAEFAFNGWNDLLFFDVSAIVNPSDTNGVKQLWPAHADGPTSGCHDYVSQPCNNVYYEPDDVQTQSTTDCGLICTLGTAAEEEALIAARDYSSDESSPKVPRDWVLGKWTSKARVR